MGIKAKTFRTLLDVESVVSNTYGETCIDLGQSQPKMQRKFCWCERALASYDGCASSRSFRVEMSSNLRQTFRNSRLFHWYKRLSAPGEYAWWRMRGSPGVKAPHLTKQRAIERYAREYGLHVLIETGTNYGHMIYVNKDRFREIYSIELDPWRAESARRKFADRPSYPCARGR